jgi:hypothetical protein
MGDWPLKDFLHKSTGEYYWGIRNNNIFHLQNPFIKCWVSFLHLGNIVLKFIIKVKFLVKNKFFLCFSIQGEYRGILFSSFPLMRCYNRVNWKAYYLTYLDNIEFFDKPLDRLLEVCWSRDSTNEMIEYLPGLLTTPTVYKKNTPLINNSSHWILRVKRDL